MSPHTITPPPTDRRRGRLKQVPPPVNSEYYWRKLLNFLYLHEQDQLFVWLRCVRAAVEEAEQAKKRKAA